MLCVYASVCVQNKSKSWEWISMKILGGVGCATGNNWMNFGDDLEYDADGGIFKMNIYHGLL